MKKSYLPTGYAPDQLSRGRLELGIGRGVNPTELSFLGITDMKVFGIDRCTTPATA